VDDRPPKILVVDDVPENVRLLEDVLTARGYRVLTAPDGIEALTVVEAEEPDLIDAEPAGEFVLKGFRRPVAAFNALAVRDAGPGVSPASMG
jgi:hypothetical protein